MKKIFLLFVIFFSTLSAEEYIYTVSMMGQKIGTSKDIWEKIENNGICILRLTTFEDMEIKRGNNLTAIKTKYITDSDCTTFEPISYFSESLSSGMTTITKAVKKEKNKFVVTIERNGAKEEKIVEFPEKSVFFGVIFKKFSPDYFLKNKSAKIISEESLTPSTLEWETSQKGSELHLSINYKGVPMNIILDNGIMVYSSLQNGVISSSLDGAKKYTEFNKKSGDMLFETSLKNNGQKVKNPRKTTKVIFELSGNIGELPKNCRQSYAKSNDKIIVTVANSAKCEEKIEESKYLQGNIYEDINHPEIKKVSEKWKNLSKEEVVKKAVTFVYSHITDKNLSHANISASEVLAKKSGDCTEHATLLSALLKSINIPVRMVYGVLLADDNRFYFHNWNEVFINNSWRQVDAAFNQFSADSSRISIAYSENDFGAREQVSLSIIKMLKNIEISVKQDK